MNSFYFAFTPAGSMVYETKAKTEKQCWENLLREASHMPYGNIAAFKKRGYTVEKIIAPRGSF